MKQFLCAVAVTAICGTWPAGASAGGTPAQKCEAAQLKAVGKDAACRAGQLAKGLLGGTADLTKCSTTFATAFMHAEAKGSCPTPFTAGQVESRLGNDIGVILSGLQLRFVDNGDGTVTDNQTGLQWEKKDNLDGVENLSDPHDADNSYTWSASGTAPTGTAFTDFLSRLNACVSTSGTTVTGGFAGHCDWRLPTIAELQTIVDLSASGCGSGSPCIDPTFGPTSASFHWSSTTVAGDPFNAFYVFFGTGVVNSFGKEVQGLVVRAVRGGL